MTVGGQTRVDLATFGFLPCFIGFGGPQRGKSGSIWQLFLERFGGV